MDKGYVGNPMAFLNSAHGLWSFIDDEIYSLVTWKGPVEFKRKSGS
jgi:hypothetical protein